jgi:hypothetical protein
MRWLTGGIRWVMVVCGLVTCTMLQALFDPQAVLQALFATTLQGPAAEIVVRNWGFLIALVGATLIYGAFDLAARRVALVLAIVSKTAFIGLVLTYGQPFLQYRAGTALAVDTVMVVIFAAYLAVTRGAAGHR